MWTNAQEFRNRHEGRLAFLIGNGMSAGNVDPTLLQPYVTMIMNEGVFKFEHPTYYFSCDHTIFTAGLLQRLADVDDKATAVWASDVEPVKTTILPPHRFIQIQRKYAPRDADDWNRMAGAYPTDERLIVGSSSAHTAAHLLHIMGCDPIVLLGMDCCQDKGYAFWHRPPYYEKATTFWRKRLGDAPLESFDAWYQANGHANLTAMLCTHAAIWKRMHEINPRLPILDASSGNLDVFPKTTLEDVLRRYGDRKTF